MLLWAATSAAQSVNTLKIKAVGDVMPGSRSSASMPKKGGQEFIGSLGDALKNTDLTIGNLECSVATKGINPSKCTEASRKAKTCFEFGTSPQLIKVLKELGFTHFSMDNNHSDDYGQAGYMIAMGEIFRNGMTYGAKRQPMVTGIRGKRVSFAAFGFDDGSYNINNLREADSIIRRLKSFSEFVIVYFHGGAEGRSAMRVEDKQETFLGENRGNVVAFARTAVDAGADVVLGSGPHVLRAMELYKNKLIAYSLGNFLTYGGFNLSGENGIAAILDFEISETNGDFVRGKIIPTAQKSPGIPFIDEKQRGAKLLKELTEEYSPDSFNFGSDFEFTPKKK